MFVVSTLSLFDINNKRYCDEITTLYFITSLIYLLILALWTVNLFRFYKISASLRLHTLMTYFICLKTIVTVVKYNDFVSICAIGYSSGLYDSLWMLFEFILSITACLLLILVSKGWGIVHVYLNPNDMKSAIYLSICISFFAIILSDKNVYTLIFIMLMYLFIINLVVNSSRPIIRSLKYYLNLLKSNIPMGDFTNHHNTLKLNLLNRLVSFGCLLIVFSMIMYIFSYLIDIFPWLVIDEFLDLVVVIPMMYELRLRVIRNFGIQPLNDIQREVTEDTTVPENEEYDMSVNSQPENEKFYLIITNEKCKHPSQGTTLLAELIEN